MTADRRQVLALFAELSDVFPDMRMGQWLTALASSARGPKVESIYDVEDDELIPVMRAYLARRRADAAPTHARPPPADRPSPRPPHLTRRQPRSAIASRMAA